MEPFLGAAYHPVPAPRGHQVRAHSHTPINRQTHLNNFTQLYKYTQTCMTIQTSRHFNNFPNKKTCMLADMAVYQQTRWLFKLAAMTHDMNLDSHLTLFTCV